MRSSSSERFNLMLIDHDPQFRRGFVARLASDSGLQVVLEADSDSSALRVLQHWFTPADTDTTDRVRLDVLVLSLDLPDRAGGAIALCQELRQRYPELPILAISQTPTPTVISAAFQAGATGYCQKHSDVADWSTAIRQVAAGYPFWTQAMGAIAPVLATPNPPLVAPPTPPLAEPSTRQQFPNPIAQIRQGLRQSGLEQIDAAIAQINAQLTRPTLSPLDYLFLTGRRRELRASRWLVNRLLKPPTPASGPSDQGRSPAHWAEGANVPPVPPPNPTPTVVSPYPEPAPLVAQPASTAIRGLQASLFDTTFAKLQFNLRNLTKTPLEIDILRDDRKRDLLAIVLRKLDDNLAELRFSEIEFAQLTEKQGAILVDLWRATTIDFFGRYTTLVLGDSPTDPLNQQPVEIVDTLLQDEAIVQAEILSKIPMVPEFFAHLLFQTPLMVDEASYAVGTVEAMNRMEALLQNLMIQVGNAVMQPLLNRFGNVVAVKQNFYDRRRLSTREIERFRNDLSWKYRIQRYFQEPTAIFESRYHLFVISELGILSASVYSPRNEELDALAGLGLAVTLTLEARDAIAPRMRAAISFVGSGVVYVLTEVIGRGIGLVGRGIIKGIGNVIQDSKFSRDSQR